MYTYMYTWMGQNPVVPGEHQNRWQMDVPPAQISMFWISM